MWYHGEKSQGDPPMSKPAVLVTRIIPEKGLALLRAETDLQIWPGELPPSRSELLELVKGKSGILCMLSDPMDREIISAASPELKVISTYAVGYDNIDIQEAAKRHIFVGNTPGILTDATADFAWALLMAAARRLPEGERHVRTGAWKNWSPSTLLGTDFKDSTLGIIGFGRIGQAVARRASGFDMHVLFYSPSRAPVEGINAQKVEDLDELLRNSDFISLHLPLTAQTKHLVNAQFLAKMKPGAILINTSRGAVVDQEALYHALKEKYIAAAALDVTDPEPLPVDHPLLTLENCLITPHIATAGRQTREKMAVVAAQNLLAGLHGTPLPYCINPQANKARDL